MGLSNGEISLKDLFDNPDNFVGCKSNLTIDKLIDAICIGGWLRCLLFKDVELQQIISKDLYKQTYETDISHVDNVKRNLNLARTILQSYARNICTSRNENNIF